MVDRYDDGTYAGDHPRWHAEDAAHKAQVVYDVLRRVGWAPATLLDVGAGTGDVLGSLLRRWHAQGQHVDAQAWDPGSPPPSALPVPPGLTHHRGDPCRDATPVDLLLCLDVVEHVQDDLTFLRDLTRLAPRMVLRAPLDLSLWDALRPRRLRRKLDHYGHVHAYTLGRLQRRLTRSGWTIQHRQFDRVPPKIARRAGRLVDGVRKAAHPIAPRLATDLLGGFSVVLALTHDAARQNP